MTWSTCPRCGAAWCPAANQGGYFCPVCRHRWAGRPDATAPRGWRPSVPALDAAVLDVRRVFQVQVAGILGRNGDGA